FIGKVILSSFRPICIKYFNVLRFAMQTDIASNFYMRATRTKNDSELVWCEVVYRGYPAGAHFDRKRHFLNGLFHILTGLIVTIFGNLVVCQPIPVPFKELDQFDNRFDLCFSLVLCVSHFFLPLDWEAGLPPLWLSFYRLLRGCQPSDRKYFPRNQNDYYPPAGSLCKLPPFDVG